MALIDSDVNSMYPHVMSALLHDTWLFDYHEKRMRWESYRNPLDWGEVYEWLWTTFGHPGTDPVTGITSDWDYHGGWLYLYNEQALLMFKLRWS